jgi:L-idonate 5-dehydrogenase
MASTRALIVYGAGDLRLEEIPLPDPAPQEAVIEIAYGGICGSDLHYLAEGRVGLSVLREPMVLGHEVVGRVDEPAADGTGPAVGTPVAIHPARFCGTCDRCLDGRRNLCRNLRYLGSAAALPHTAGGFADRLLVETERLVPLPPGLDLGRAALAEPAAVAVHAVGRVAGVGGAVEGRSALVIGAGPIGLLAIAALRRRGAGGIAAADIRPEPLVRAAAIGASTTIDLASGQELPAEVDIVIESSGSAAGIAAAVDAAASGGVVVALGQLPGPSVSAALHTTVTREVTITGSSRFDAELPAVVAALADGSLAVDGIVTHHFPLAQAAEAFALARDTARSGKVLLELAGADA